MSGISVYEGAHKFLSDANNNNKHLSQATMCLLKVLVHIANFSFQTLD